MYIASTLSSALKLLTRFGILLHAGIKSHMRAQMCPFTGGFVKNFRQTNVLYN